MYHILDEEHPETPIPPMPTIIQDGFLIVLGGSDTSSTVLSSACFYLTTHPETYQCLRAEIDSAFPPAEGLDPIDSGKLATMQYLNAVINEAMRLLPPCLTYMQRAPEPGSGGHTLGTDWIPEGTAVIIPPYTVHRDPTHFSPFPDAFIPERWLTNPTAQKPSSDTEQLRRINFVTNHKAFVPFSLGPMNCPGKGLALLEMRMTIALLVQKFDMRLQDGWSQYNWENQIEDYFISSTGELPVVLSKR